MVNEKQLFKSAWIAPMESPPIRDGAVLVAGGKIQDVGPAKQIASRHPDAQIVELGDAVILPGLINAHTHLELSHCRRGDPPRSFAEWILSIPKRRTDQSVEPAVGEGIQQCLRFGVTCVGDITQQIAPTRSVLAASPLRCVSFGEVLGLGKLREKFESLLPRAMDLGFASERLRIGLSPHAPYTVDLPGYEQCLRLATDHNLPLATHLAESADEIEFLKSHAGPLRELWDSLGTWSDDVQTWSGSSIAMAGAIGLLSYPAVLAHVNYCTDHEMMLLSQGVASVVYCPRTHQFFGHPPHRWLEMLKDGINLAIGTDSCASSPDLNLVDELRLLHRIAPDVPAQMLWELVTTRAAKALRMEDEIGALSVDRWADFAVFETKSNDPLLDVLERDVLPQSVWIAGRQVK